MHLDDATDIDLSAYDVALTDCQVLTNYSASGQVPVPAQEATRGARHAAATDLRAVRGADGREAYT